MNARGRSGFAIDGGGKHCLRTEWTLGHDPVDANPVSGSTEGDWVVGSRFVLVS